MPSTAPWSSDSAYDAYADADTLRGAPERTHGPPGAAFDEEEEEGFVLGPSEVVPLIYRREPRVTRAPIPPHLQPTLDAMTALPGCIAAALLDTCAEKALAHVEAPDFPLAEAFAAAARELDTEREAVEALGFGARIDDIVVHEPGAYHLVRPVHGRPELCLFLALDADAGDVVAARATLADLEAALPDAI